MQIRHNIFFHPDISSFLLLVMLVMHQVYISVGWAVCLSCICSGWPGDRSGVGAICRHDSRCVPAAGGGGGGGQEGSNMNILPSNKPTSSQNQLHCCVQGI